MKTTLGIAALIASAMMLSGCAIPIGVQIAKWSLDGISYVTTQKSLTDHGLSLVTGEDCAMHRIVTKGKMCSEWNDDESIVVDLEVAPGGEEAAVPEPENATIRDPVAEFETAAGQPKEIAPPTPALNSAPSAPAPLAAVPVQPAPASVESRLDRTEPASIEARALPERQPGASAPETAFVPEGDGVMRVWGSDAEVETTVSANHAKTEEVALAAGSAAPAAKPATPVAAVVGLPEGRALLSLWETGVELRDNVISMREWRKILEIAEIPGVPDKPARPEPDKAANIGTAEVARVSGLSRGRARPGGA